MLPNTKRTLYARLSDPNCSLRSSFGGQTRFYPYFSLEPEKEIQIVLQDARSWGAQFVTFIPELKVD